MSHVTIITWMVNLVPSPRCGFSFEASFQLWDLKLTISVYIRNASGKICVSLIIFVNACLEKLLNFRG